MSGDFFDRLDGELSRLAGGGAHLDGAARRQRRRLVLTRRAAMVAALVVALAVSLVSEFPATAGGRAIAAVTVSALGR